MLSLRRRIIVECYKFPDFLGVLGHCLPFSLPLSLSRFFELESIVVVVVVFVVIIDVVNVMFPNLSTVSNLNSKTWCFFSLLNSCSRFTFSVPCKFTATFTNKNKLTRVQAFGFPLVWKCIFNRDLEEKKMGGIGLHPSSFPVFVNFLGVFLTFVSFFLQTNFSLSNSSVDFTHSHPPSYPVFFFFCHLSGLQAIFSSLLLFSFSFCVYLSISFQPFSSFLYPVFTVYISGDFPPLLFILSSI